MPAAHTPHNVCAAHQRPCSHALIGPGIAWSTGWGILCQYNPSSPSKITCPLLPAVVLHTARLQAMPHQPPTPWAAPAALPAVDPHLASEPLDDLPFFVSKEQEQATGQLASKVRPGACSTCVFTYMVCSKLCEE